MKRFLLTMACFALCGLASQAQLPKADVLDIVFNDDGTVMDASAMQNPVTVHGVPRIEKSTQYGMNVLCQSDEQWGAPTPNFISIDRNEQLDGAIGDGVTFETLIRPYFANGQFNKAWVNLFGGYQGGGIGIIIYNGVYDFEASIGGRYYDAVNNSTPVANEWVHLTGVWNKEEGTVKLFIDGQLAGSVSGATGDMSSSSNTFYALGVDYEPSSQYLASNLFSGDIALARIYDKPLTDEEVAAVYADIQSKKLDSPEHEEEPVLRTDEDGTVLIANTEELTAFGRAVRQSKTKLNARLEADVEYSGANKMLSTDEGYAGTFDGQGHTITLTMNRDNNDAGLFKYLSGATVKDLTIRGEITTAGKFAGALAAETTGNNFVSRVQSSVNIISTIEGDGTHGGFFGVPGGTLTIDNCLFDGSIQGETTSHCGGFVGWASGTVNISNSLLIATMSTNEEECYTFARKPGNVHVSNCYYLAPYGEVNEGATQLDEEQLASGEICWLLNGSKIGTAWLQTLTADKTPTLQAGHGIVVGMEYDYKSIQDEASLKSVSQSYATYLHEKASDIEAYEPLIAQLKADIDQLATSATIEDFLTQNQRIEDDFAAIETNQAAYIRLTEAVEQALVELNDLDNPMANILREYLTDDVEPNETFINGSYLYILQHYSLSTEGIDGELQYISEMLQKAMSNDIPAGTDVTLLLANADFSEGDAGWDGTKANNYTSNPNSGQWYGVKEGYKTQTLTGLKNGIYELRMNAFDMVGDDNYCAFYTAVILANEMEIPVMSPMEDAILVEDAVEGVNSYRNDRLVDDMYYIPYSRVGGAVAFSAGRYLNRVLVEVKDGTLTVGIRLDGSGRSDDWLMFANAKLFYQGTFDEADEALDNVLAGAIARGKTTINYEGDATGTNYLFMPNYSQALREEMTAAVASAEAATDAEAKYAALTKLSDLFKQIYACRKAYRELAINLTTYYDCIYDYPDYIEIIQEKADEAWNGWMDGTFSAEEALAKGEALLAEMSTYSIEMPVADLLDVVFNADGTATDVSAAQNPVEAVGSPRIVASPALGMNVFCHTKDKWGSKPENYFKVLPTEALKQGLADGVTFELLTRPYCDEEDNPDNWATVLGMEQDGGMGMIVYNNKWDFEVHAGGYKDAYSTSAPVMGEWTHLVGVYNQEAGTISIYVNGKFASAVNTNGNYKATVITDDWMGIGCDINTDKQGEASYKGDIALARIYDKPVNTSQVNILYKKAMEHFTGEPEHTEGPNGVIRVAQERPMNEEWYDLTGRRIEKPVRGLYIKNGQKVLVK